MSIQIALAQCSSYEEKEVENKIFQLLDAADISIKQGSRVLLKPNLLMNRPLACTSSEVVHGVAKWLLEKGANVIVADSPAFGNVNTISESIGLTARLKRLGLEVQSLSGKQLLNIKIGNKNVKIPVSPKIFENDCIFSVCRVKAHSQMRLTLSVKNCFGVIPGLRKAFIHTKYGDTTEFFAECIAGLYKNLPPVIGVADGIIAMNVTGPTKGDPYPLKLLGACADPVALDLAIMKVLKAPIEIVPLAKALGKSLSDIDHYFPMLKPEDFDATDFIIPTNLKPASFAPWQLVKSCVKRIWTGLKR